MKPLGKTRKRLALFVTAIGIYTFFTSMVIVEPAVLNRTRWSALEITLSVYDGKLPVPGGSFDEGLLEIGAIYVLLILALGALFIPGPPKALLRLVPLALFLVPSRNGGT